MVSDQTLAEFSAELTSKAPTPGGGGASSVCGALAASLGAMVGNLTLGKKKYAEVEPRVKEIIPQLEALRDRLLELSDADAAAFEPLSRAYGLPKATPEEQTLKAEVMEAALRTACEPPFQIMETTCQVVDLLAELAQIGTRIAISDVGVGAAFASAALKGASLNVFINAKSMKDRDYADELVAKTQTLLDDGCQNADRTYLAVERGIRWAKH